jgi:hypothetical protein
VKNRNANSSHHECIFLCFFNKTKSNMEFSESLSQLVIVLIAIAAVVILYQEFVAPSSNSILNQIRNLFAGKPKKKESKTSVPDYLLDAGAGPLTSGAFVAGSPAPTRYGSTAADMEAAFGVPESFQKPVQVVSGAADKPALSASLVKDQSNQDVVPTYQPGKVKDPLKPEDLLPQDKNSVWAQVNPQGSGSLQYKNFLEAGYHVGIDTIGASKRNANRQLRPDVPNPRSNVGPWMNTVIDQDYNISKPLL